MFFRVTSLILIHNINQYFNFNVWCEQVKLFKVWGTKLNTIVFVFHTKFKDFCYFQEVTKSKQVLLVISLSGIKVCSSSGQVSTY